MGCCNKPGKVVRPAKLSKSIKPMAAPKTMVVPKAKPANIKTIKTTAVKSGRKK